MGQIGCVVNQGSPMTSGIESILDFSHLMSKLFKHVTNFNQAKGDSSFLIKNTK